MPHQKLLDQTDLSSDDRAEVYLIRKQAKVVDYIYVFQNSDLSFVTGESAALKSPAISEYLLPGEYFSLHLGSDSGFYW